MQRYYTTMAKSSSLYSDNNSVSKCVFAYVFPLISLCILLFLMATIRANGRHHTRRCRRPSAQMVAVKKYHVLIEQGKRIINLLDAAIYFSQIISLLPHTNLTNLTNTASLKARSCRLCRVFTNRMASTSVASEIREIREICVKSNVCKNRSS